MQGPFQVMPNAVRRADVEGTEKPQTVNVTGTCALAPPLTTTVPVYLPAGASAGTCTSTYTTRFSPAGTSNGNAFRFSPAIGSTSGTSASGHQPDAPAPPATFATVRGA